MIRLAVISGKGGTGKTMLTAALSQILTGTMVLADCDVDAANLELLLQPHVLRTDPFMGSKTAAIDPARCIGCGKCREHCRFGAIEQDGDIFRVDPLHCEGCSVCVFVCPDDAVTLRPRQTGGILYSEIARGHLVHAGLVPGAGNSGLLVHAVKKTAFERDGKSDLFLIDGPPGTGCPLLSTVTGMDAVLVVTEPSISGFHDLKRVITVCRQFRPRIFVAVNRYDLNLPLTNDIIEYCHSEKIPLAGTIPFDPAVIDAVRKGIPVTNTGQSPAAQAIQILAANLYREVKDLGTGL